MSVAAMAVSSALLDARMVGVRDWLDNGTGNASLEIYSGAYPVEGTLLGVMQLAKPCGAVANGVLTLQAANVAGDMVLANGEARWLRCKSAAGVAAFDTAVSVHGGTGEVGGAVIAGASEGANKGAMLYAGGKLPAVSLQIS